MCLLSSSRVELKHTFYWGGLESVFAKNESREEVYVKRRFEPLQAMSYLIRRSLENPFKQGDLGGRAGNQLIWVSASSVVDMLRFESWCLQNTRL